MDNGDGTVSNFVCTSYDKGATWSCVQAAPEPPPHGIKDAIVKAQAGAITGGATTGENNTNVIEGKVLKRGGALIGGSSNTNVSDNSGNNPNIDKGNLSRPSLLK